MAEKTVKSTAFEDHVPGRTGGLENFGTTNCANRLHAWHGWHKGSGSFQRGRKGQIPAENIF
jgi:hypothetical protein